MVVQRCKGSRDLVPEEMARFRIIEDKFRDIAGKSGYREVRTPTLEYLHLFTSIGTLTPSMLKRVYSFLDWDGWSGERVVLRPDVTIPVARLYIENMAKERLARLFYVSNVFRFEGTGRKTRERWQCGLELLGVSSSVADAELVRLALSVLAELGLKDITVRLSHGGLIHGLLAGFGLSREEQTAIFDRILDGDTSGLKKLKGVSPEMARALGSLLELSGQSSGFLKNFKAMFVPAIPALEAPLNDFISTVDLVESLGGNCVIDITTGRGFEYYTGIMFQLFSGKNIVGGGGRYDDLIPLVGGAKVPASGLALNIYTIMDLLPETAAKPPDGTSVLVKAEPEAIAEAFGVITGLQRAGYRAEMYLGAQDMSAYGRILLVKAAGGGFVLTDTAKVGSQTLPSLEAVIGALGKAA
jgi:histidyl-tRNA synthetase